MSMGLIFHHHQHLLTLQCALYCVVFYLLSVLIKVKPTTPSWSDWLVYCLWQVQTKFKVSTTRHGSTHSKEVLAYYTCQPDRFKNMFSSSFPQAGLLSPLPHGWVLLFVRPIWALINYLIKVVDPQFSATEDHALVLIDRHQVDGMRHSDQFPN